MRACRGRDERGATLLEWVLVVVAAVMTAAIVSAAVLQIVNGS